MTKENEIDFSGYEKRIKELGRLLKTTRSRTMQELFERAKTDTEESLEKFAQLHKMTIVILYARDITMKKDKSEYENALKTLSTSFPGLNDNNELRTALQSKIDFEQKMHSLTYQVYTFAIRQFQTILLDLIFKPNNKVFHYESILDALNYLAGKLIPGFDDMNTAKQIVPAIRKKDFAAKGDKLILYMEQYLDAIGKWTTLADAYIEILNS